MTKCTNHYVHSPTETVHEPTVQYCYGSWLCISQAHAVSRLQ